jgi:hypothetical protein
MTQKGYCRRSERIYKLSLGQRVRSDNPSLLLTLRPLPDMSSISAPSPSRLLSTSDLTPRRNSTPTRHASPCMQSDSFLMV